MVRATLLALASCFGLSLAAGAAGFDGSDALVCTLDTAAECDTEGDCATVPRAEIELPESINVDFKAGRLSGPKRSSPIGGKEVTETVLVLQGHENGRGWSMAIDRATGHMTGTIADIEGAFVLTGTCSKAP